LECFGVIGKAAYSSLTESTERPLPSPPPPSASAKGRKRARAIEVKEDRKPNIQQAGGSGPRADVVEPNPKHQDAIGPLARPSSISRVDDDTQDRKPEITSAVTLSVNAGAVNGVRPQRSDVRSAADVSTDTGPTHAVQDPASVGQALARLSVDPEFAKPHQGQADNTEDAKPEINAVARSSSIAVPQTHTQSEDSDEEDMDMWSKIEMHQASLTSLFTLPADDRQKEIERIQRAIKDKGKGKKRAKVEREASVKIENVRKEKVVGGQPTDLTEDSE
jgi:hypothetical protein